MSETYNGWTNRETWAFALHLNNDYGLYLWAHDLVRDFIENHDGAAFHQIGERLIESVEEMWSEGIISPENERMMRDDIGSMWRIDAYSIGESFGTDAIEGHEDKFKIEDGFVLMVEEEGA